MTHELNLITLDLRFVEIDYELWALGEYISSLERGMEPIQRLERARTEELLRDQGTTSADAEIDLAFQELHERIHMIIPRFFRGPVLVTMAAVFEAAVEELARRIGDPIPDQRGRAQGFLDRAEDHFRNSIGIPLTSTREQRERLDALWNVRNVVAHGNGRLSAAKSSSRTRVQRLASAGCGVKVERDYLMISEQFVAETLAAVTTCLQDLLRQVRCQTSVSGPNN